METAIVDYYDKLARDYDRDRFGNSYGRFIDGQERKVLTRWLNDPREIVLDLACGSGRLLSFATVGADASKEMLEVAGEKFPEKKLIHADAERLPLEDNSIDTIIAFHLFMHLDRDKTMAIMNEARRVLKENGRIVFDVPSKKRRRLTRYKSQGWHGAFSLSLKELAGIPGFRIGRVSGVLFLPIHRFPVVVRPFLSAVDVMLSYSPLKEYSSYLIVELHKHGNA